MRGGSALVVVSAPDQANEEMLGVLDKILLSARRHGVHVGHLVQWSSRPRSIKVRTDAVESQRVRDLRAAHRAIGEQVDVALAP